ncbi:MAG TPA: DNA polymerase/3'-5' exonuclease PolX [Candidatus Omnitrophota bacterium]|nr:DNA polymerase/3'-5' exonuclease PolX [Candidatus Omnitrophota bacterium]
MKNQLVSRIFRDIARLLEIKGENIFRIRAYDRAAQAVENLGGDIEQAVSRNTLTDIPGIGKDLADKIREIVATGSLQFYEDLKQTLPAGTLELLAIPSVGPKTAQMLAKELRIRSIGDLEKAIADHKLDTLPGIKEKTIENISKGIALVKRGQERLPLVRAQAVAEEFVRELQQLPQVEKIVCAGSLRRQKETVRDIDILVMAKDAQPVMDAFTSSPLAQATQAWGSTKSSVRTADGVQVDCRVVDKGSFGAALLYFTGSKEFNVRLRMLAQKTRHKINEYGVFDRNEKRICGRTEEEIFKFLKMQYVPPEMREDTGEIEAALKRALPRLVEQKDIQGDLHVHSNWSDGSNTIAEMAQAARASGYSYIAVTDHSPSLKVAHGLSAVDLRKKRREIDSLNEKMKPFRILFGTEADIDADGNIDYPDSVLKEFDIVIAAIHTGMKQPAEQITRRIIRACENPHVHIIAHPTGRLRGVRDAYDLDLDAVFQKAKQTNTAFEINSYPDRMDLNDVNCRRAKEAGVKICINTDSHSIDQLVYIRFGLAMARRGWLTPQNILNTNNEDALAKALSRR